MKTLISLILLASICTAQIPHTTASQQGDNAFTGNNTHAGTETFSGTVSVQGTLGVGGPSPWVDVTTKGIVAGVDGSSILQAILTPCATFGGEIFFPVNTSGTHYKFASAVNENGGAGCALDGHSGPTGPILEFTGAAGGFQAFSTNGIDIHDITLEQSNAGFTGNILDMGHNGGGGLDSSGNYVNRVQIAGLGVSGANSALSLDKTIFSTVNASLFANAANLIQMAASNTSYSNGNRIFNSIFSSSTGNCSNSMILNPAQGTAVIGNGFELGVALGNCAPLAFTASASAAGLLWAGNWHGDSNSAVDRNLLNWNVGGGAAIGNYFGANTTHDTIFKVSAGSSLAAYGNQISGGKVAFDVSAGNAFVDIAGNDCRASAPTTQLNGTPTQGRWQDCSNGNTSYYGVHIFTGNTAIIERNNVDAEQDFFIEPGLTAEQNGFIVWTDRTHAINEWKMGKGNDGNFTFHLFDVNGVDRLNIADATNSSLSANGSGNGGVQINNQANSGTGGLLLNSGGVTPTRVAQIDSTGDISFHGSSSFTIFGKITAAPTAARTYTFQDATGTVPLTIASGTSTFTTTAVGSGACQTTVTTAATSALTSDTITTAYTTAPVAATDGMLTLQSYLTAGNVNFMRCNPTAGSITPTALVINWRVIR